MSKFSKTEVIVERVEREEEEVSGKWTSGNGHGPLFFYYRGLTIPFTTGPRRFGIETTTFLLPPLRCPSAPFRVNSGIVVGRRPIRQYR